MYKQSPAHRMRGPGSSLLQTSRRRFMKGAALAGLAAGTGAVVARAGASGSDVHRSAGIEGLVIEAGWVLVDEDGDLRLLQDGQVLVREGMIERIQGSPIPGSFPRLRLPADILLPGFISGHTHCCSATPTRGIIEGPRSYQRPLEIVETLSDDEMDALTALNLAELLRSGCTTQVEMSLSLRQAESYVRCAEAMRARGYPGAMIPGIERLFNIWFRASDQVLLDAEGDTLDEIARNLAFCKRHMGKAEGRIRPMLSPHACDTHTPATMRALAEAAVELGTGLHIHLSQGQGETDTVRRLWGMTPTQWMDSFGMLDSGPVFGAHMSGLDWDIDPPILAERGVVYAHCPSAGGAGNGTQPYPEALAAGLKVNIGIDTHSNDYLENLKLAVLYGQARHQLLTELGSALESQRPSIQDALEGATRVPARALGRSDLGVIREGARADLVSVDVSGMLGGSGALPPEPLQNLLYASGRMVRTVMTDGHFQVLDGEFIAQDPERLLEEGGAVVSKIWRQLKREGWFET